MRHLASLTEPARQPSAALQQQFFDDTGGGHPTATIQFPSTFNGSPTTPRPLFVLLHGYSNLSTAQAFQANMGLSTLAEDENALVIAPIGRADGGSSRYWNATRGCCDLDGDGTNPNDVAYLGGLIDDIIAAGWPVDPTEIYVIGSSNGAFMANRLASERSDIAAIWAHAGAGRSTGDAARPYPANVSVLEAHGTGDGSIAYGGGTFVGMPDPYPAVQGAGGTLDQWAVANGCSGSLTNSGTTADYDSVAVGSETEIHNVTGCPADGEIQHWRMVGSAHAPTFTAAGVDAAIAWLRAHAR